MIKSLARKIFGSVNDRRIKSFWQRVPAIEAFEPALQKLSDQELQAQTSKLKAKLAAGASLDELLPEAFATAREAARRVLGQRHYPVQLIGGMVIHDGMIAEMKTGEGKTLAATLPAYLNALTGKGVHIVTVNDYLAQRDASWMGQIFRFLGLEVGCIIAGTNDEDRKAAYQADILYVTNNELGFDYLRDNMKFSPNELVQRPFHYVIIDEVDSILIDEARTPLIISGPAQNDTKLYVLIDKIVNSLDKAGFEIDEKKRTITLNDAGNNQAEELMVKAGLLDVGDSLYDIDKVDILHHLNQALKAHYLFQKDRDYIIKDKRIVIIDEFTGRMMEGRRFSEGLHQALEAKEQVPIQNENQTLASTTFQNFFRLYPRIAGMAGTAMTEAAEFMDIYKLDVIEIPTNVTVIRRDEDDEIYQTIEEKNNAILAAIRKAHEKGQPVLVGTVSIEKSEHLAKLLKKEKIPHHVLNARYHEKEAYIIAQAGRLGAVTIATNMAGRGTDIQLGGNVDMMFQESYKPEMSEAEISKLKAKIAAQVAEEKSKVLAAGGLMVMGTERHESRRIDNQLRGRSGRQGDPGFTKFYLSLQDDLMRIFGSENVAGLLAKLGLKNGEAIQHPWISKAIEKAQIKVERHNFEIRKTLLRFDDVMNDQRQVVYTQRKELMQHHNLDGLVRNLAHEVSQHLIAEYVPEQNLQENWDLTALTHEVKASYTVDFPGETWLKEHGEELTQAKLATGLEEALVAHIESKKAKLGAEVFSDAQTYVIITTLDQLWKDHLLSLDHLRAGINLRAYGQKDPLNEFKREAFGLFQQMMDHFQVLALERIARFEIRSQEDFNDLAHRNHPHMTRMVHQSPAGPLAANQNDSDGWGKVGRNQECPCGSGKKFKHCHGMFS